MDKLQYGHYYHIYNRGINSSTIFKQEDDYAYFLILLQKYLLAIANIYCYALMGNHFHILVEIKDEKNIPFLSPHSPMKNENKWQYLSPNEARELGIPKKQLKKPNPSRQFSHLFNAYTKHFNSKYSRTGSLFEKNFKRIEVTNEDYLRQLVYYIHHNPLHHGISLTYNDYQWTSYNDYLNKKPTFLKKEAVIGWFDDLDNFVYFHREEHELSIIKDWLID